MRKPILFAVLAALIVVSGARAADTEAVAKAQAASNAWLALADAGKYGATWDEAAGVFRKSISRADWEKALSGVRSQLGALKSRKVKSATFTKTLPGVPEGEYVVVQYDAEFAGKGPVVETVTPMRESDGVWRVAGYFIK